MLPLINVAQLEERLGRVLVGAEVAQAKAFIADASALIRVTAGATFLDDAEALAVPEAIIPVVVRVVDRALENPQGLEGETTGNHSWRAAPEGSGVYLSKRDRADVRAATGRSVAGDVTLEGYLEGSGLELPIDITP